MGGGGTLELGISAPPPIKKSEFFFKALTASSAPTPLGSALSLYIDFVD